MPKNIKIEQKYIDRFWSKVEKADTCWLWKAGKNSDGYGIFYSGKESGMIHCHRLSYLLYFGEIPHNLLVLHTCDIRACVNLAHLFLGTDLTNSKDRNAKRRHAHGVRQGKAKLNDFKILLIRQMAAQGMTQRAIAKELNIDSHSTIGNILRRETWMHVIG